MYGGSRWSRRASDPLSGKEMGRRGRSLCILWILRLHWERVSTAEEGIQNDWQGALQSQLLFIKALWFHRVGLYRFILNTHRAHSPSDHSVSCFFKIFWSMNKRLCITSAVCPPHAQGPRGVKWKAVQAASISRQSVWRQWDRAAGKILKGRCGCSNVLTNSRKFPLNPVCWVFCAGSQLRRRRVNRGREGSHLLFTAERRKEKSWGKLRGIKHKVLILIYSMLSHQKGTHLYDFDSFKASVTV